MARLVETAVTLEVDLGAAFERSIDVLQWRLDLSSGFFILQTGNKRHSKRKDKVCLHI